MMEVTYVNKGSGDNNTSTKLLEDNEEEVGLDRHKGGHQDGTKDTWKSLVLCFQDTTLTYQWSWQQEQRKACRYGCQSCSLGQPFHMSEYPPLQSRGYLRHNA